MLEAIKRRAKRGRRIPRKLTVELELDEQTGEVLLVLVPHLYDWA